MAIAFEIRIGDLLPELLTDALILLGPLQAAGAITAGAFQSLADFFYNFSHFHLQIVKNLLFLCFILIEPIYFGNQTNGFLL